MDIKANRYALVDAGCGGIAFDLVIPGRLGQDPVAGAGLAILDLNGIERGRGMSGGEGGGSWTQSGNAAGVAWSGGGSYTLALDGDGSGRIEARGSSSIATPMGRFSDSVEPVFSVTRVDQACD